MNYRESKVYLEEISKYGSVLGLENMRDMMQRLENPQDRLKIIHISGTNGKGSALAYISTVLKEQGYKVGRYISPTLFSYEERIQVNEEEIGGDDLARLLTKVRDVIDTMVAEGKSHPTVFEVETALSFLYFLEMQCDYVVLETGLGGDEDATNIVKTTILEVITGISMDHMGFLGNTLAEIATCKAGIIKPHTTVVSQVQDAEAMKVIETVCQREMCDLRVVDSNELNNIVYGYPIQTFTYREKQIEIGLIGTYQIENAALAIEAIEALRDQGIHISEEAMLAGMKKTQWNGRFTMLSEHPLVVMDGAHNEAAARELAKSIEIYFPGRRIIYVMGVFADKEYEKIIDITGAYPEHVITTQTPDNPRAMDAYELQQAWEKQAARARGNGFKGDLTITCMPDVAQAVKQGMKLATEGSEEGIVIAYGSLSFLGIVRDTVASNGCE